MTKYLPALLLSFVVTLTFGCSSSTSPGTNSEPDTVKGRMGAWFELSQFVADTTWVEQPNSSQFVIFGEMSPHRSDSVLVILSLTGVSDTGTYYMEGSGLDNQQCIIKFSGKTYWTNQIGGGGQCRITKFDKTKRRVSGTFGCNVSRTSNPNDWFNVSDGEFTDVKF